MQGHNHPVFSRFYNLLAGAGEHTALADARSRILSGVHGRLLIVGLGPGHDLDHLPPAVQQVVAVEPSDEMRRLAAARVGRTRSRGVGVEVLDAVGEDLPLPDDSVDAALLALVMCSVADVDAVLREVRRVLVPGGPVAVLEHVRAAEGTWMRRVQQVVAPVWPHLSGGCHADRPTRQSLERAGFDTSGVRDSSTTYLPPVAPTIVGVATAP